MIRYISLWVVLLLLNSNVLLSQSKTSETTITNEETIVNNEASITTTEDGKFKQKTQQVGDKMKKGFNNLKGKFSKKKPNKETQDTPCQPAAAGVDKNGDTLKYYGGVVRPYKLITDYKADYKLYLVQIDNGQKGTFLYSILSETFKEQSEYNVAVNNYLNQNALKSSTLKIILMNGETLAFDKPLTCEHKALRSKLFGNVFGHNTTFISLITKDQIQMLQESPLQFFQLNIGGKPFETKFKKPKKRNIKIKNSFACLDLNTVQEMKQKKAEDLDMTEVTKANYKSTIVGTWTSESEGRYATLVLTDDGKMTVSATGATTLEGTYKIVNDRIICVADGKRVFLKLHSF